MQLNFFNKNYQLQLASNQLPATSNQSPVANRQQLSVKFFNEVG